MKLPDIVIVMSVYFPASADGIRRVAAAHDTLVSWDKYLEYEGNLRLHIADDDSELGKFDPSLFWFRQRPDSITYSTQKRHGVGASLNAGFRAAYEYSPLVFYAVDDWSLTQPFNLTPWATLLLQREDIGMVRLGPPHPNLTGRIEHLAELGWGLKLDDYSYAYAQRPALYHRRFTDAYGWFPEDMSALECERIYAERVVSNPNAPKVMLALPHPWDHIYTVSMSDWSPK